MLLLSICDADVNTKSAVVDRLKAMPCQVMIVPRSRGHMSTFIRCLLLAIAWPPYVGAEIYFAAGMYSPAASGQCSQFHCIALSSAFAFARVGAITSTKRQPEVGHTACSSLSDG